MPIRSLTFLLLTLLLAILSACAPADTAPDAQSGAATAKNAHGYTDITVEVLAQRLPDKDFTLVNVHIPYEGELPQTDAFIPYNEITQHLDQLPNKDAPILLYCRSGSMSTTAAEQLVELGYTNVMELDGGFNAWQAAGHALIQKPQ